MNTHSHQIPVILVISREITQNLEPLQNKNRQNKIINFTLMKDQAVTNVIQMFPPV